MFYLKEFFERGIMDDKDSPIATIVASVFYNAVNITKDDELITTTQELHDLIKQACEKHGIELVKKLTPRIRRVISRPAQRVEQPQKSFRCKFTSKDEETDPGPSGGTLGLS
jgi:hypothetical protein